MTESAIPNPFLEFFTNADVVGPIIVSDEDDGTIFSDAIESVFGQTMSQLAEQVPDDDEDAANALMAEAVQNLMVICFKAGMVFQAEIDPHEDDADPGDAIAVPLNPEQAAQLVMGLVGNNAPSLRLFVDRGPQ